MEEEGFVKMSPRYERSNKAGVSLVMKLEKRLNGFSESAKNGFGTMNQCFGGIGFRPVKSVPCVYMYEVSFVPRML